MKKETRILLTVIIVVIVVALIYSTVLNKGKAPPAPTGEYSVTSTV